MSESLPLLTETQRYSLVKKHQLKLVTVVDLAASAANGDFAFKEFRELREAFFTPEHPGLNKLISELQAKLGTKIEDGDAAFRALDGLPLPGYAVLFKGYRQGVFDDQAWFYAKTLDEAWLLAAAWEGALFDEINADPEQVQAPAQQASSAPTPADPAKSEHYTKLFMDACRGIDARDIAAAMAMVTPATNWTNCPKSFIATRYGLVMAGKSVSLVTADFDGMRSLNLQALVDTARARAEGVMDWRKVYQPLSDEEQPTAAPSAPAAPATSFQGLAG